MSENTVLFEKFGRTIETGEAIFQEGDTGNQMFIIQKGRVRISKKIGGREHILSVLGKGDFFGEMAIVNNVKRTATATALTEVELLSFNREGFTNMITKNAQIALNIIDKLCRRLQNMNLQIQHLVRKNSKGLIALNLLYTFKGEGEQDAILSYKKTLEDIAVNLELPQDQIETHIQFFAERNIIKINGDKLTLLDREKLNKFTEGLGG
jgi:CRP-like cAMP-binding protein